MYKADLRPYFIFLSMSETAIPVSSEDTLIADLSSPDGYPDEVSHTEETSIEE